MGAKGSQNTFQSQTYSPVGASFLTNALNQAQGLAGQNFTVPTAPVAGFSPQQQQAFNLAGQNIGIANPYLSQAQSYYNQGTTPNVSQFFNPFSGAVMSQLQNLFGQQQQQNNANLVQSAGGVGADRIAVGQGNLANQQGLSAGQTLANLYQPALSAALSQEGVLQNAGAGTAGLGQQAQTAGINDVNQLLTAGGLQQQLQQAQLNAPYNQQLAQLALPYQLSQFNTAATGSLAPALGGTTQGQSQTQYNPSLFSQLLGGGALGLSAIGGTGGFGSGGWLTGLLAAKRGGAINPYAYDDGGGVGGSIPSGGFSLLGNGIIPTSPFHAAQAPRPQLSFSSPNMQQMGQQGMSQLQGLAKQAGQMSGSFSGPAFGGGSMFGGDAFGGNAGNPLAGLDASDYGSARGGSIRNPYYDDGGDVPGTDALRAKMIDAGYIPDAPGNIEDRFEPTKQAIASGEFDPMGANETTFQGTPGMVASNQGNVPLPASRPGDAPAAVVAQSDDDDADDAAKKLQQEAQFHHDEFDKIPDPPAPTTGTQTPVNPYNAAPSGDGTSGFGNFLKSPWMALAMAGLGAFTPAGFAGGAAQGIKMLQGQESIDQAARRLDEEVRQHQFEQTQLSAYQKAQIEVAKQKIAADTDEVIDDDTARYYGKIFAQTGSMPSLGYGRNAAQNRAKIAKFAMQETTPDQAVANRVDFAANRAGATTAARQQAGIDRAVIEAQNTFPLAEQASAAVPRGQWVPINRATLAIKSGTSDPAMAAFVVANQGAVNAYAAAMGRGSPVTTVHAQQHAEELLSTAQSHQAYVAALHQMQKEMAAARAAPAQVRQDIRGQITGQPGTGATSAAPAGFTGRTAINRQTGQRIRETTDGNWVQ